MKQYQGVQELKWGQGAYIFIFTYLYLKETIFFYWEHRWEITGVISTGPVSLSPLATHPTNDQVVNGLRDVVPISTKRNFKLIQNPG